jgi:hypothetical protein
VRYINSISLSFISIRTYASADSTLRLAECFVVCSCAYVASVYQAPMLIIFLFYNLFLLKVCNQEAKWCNVSKVIEKCRNVKFVLK